MTDNVGDEANKQIWYGKRRQKASLEKKSDQI